MTNTAYHVFAYQGGAWLDDLGVFETFDEAQDALTDAMDEYIDLAFDHGSGVPVDEDELTMECDRFLFESRIEEIYY